MKFRNFRLMNAADAQTSTGASAAAQAPNSDSTASDQSTTAGASGAPAGDAGAAAPGVQADANQQTSADGKPAGDASDGAASTEPAVPEKYEFKTADGQAIEGEFVGKFEAIAKDLKLPQEAAQRVAQLGAEMHQSFAAQQAQSLLDAVQKWESEAAADQEIGGTKLQENLAISKKALAELGTPALADLLEKSKLGSHPEVIRFLVRSGKAISQDSRLVTGARKPTIIESNAQRMYPNMNP